MPYLVLIRDTIQPVAARKCCEAIQWLWSDEEREEAVRAADNMSNAEAGLQTCVVHVPWPRVGWR